MFFISSKKFKALAEITLANEALLHQLIRSVKNLSVSTSNDALPMIHDADQIEALAEAAAKSREEMRRFFGLPPAPV